VSESTFSAELLLAAQAGDSAARERVIVMSQEMSLRWAYPIVGRMEDARDVAQEVALQLSRGLATFDATRPYTPWLRKIAVRTAWHWMRKNRPAPVSRGPERAAGPVDVALDKLSPNERTAITLKIIHGYSAAEIGEIMDCAPETVRSHLSRGLRKLRDDLST
jgi:RNA polymerase sigma-70 factor (ECF subfamily)